MARGEGPGWHHESRRHSEVQQNKRPTHARATNVKRTLAETIYQEAYVKAFLNFEKDDLNRMNFEYEGLDDGSFDEPELIDQIQQGEAHIKLAKLMGKMVKKNLTNDEFVAQLKTIQKDLITKAQTLQEKQFAMDETDYDEDRYKRVFNSRREAEWQSEMLTYIIDDMSRGVNFQ